MNISIRITGHRTPSRDLQSGRSSKVNRWHVDPEMKNEVISQSKEKLIENQLDNRLSAL